MTLPAWLRGPLLFLVVLTGYASGSWIAFELLAVSDLGAVFFAPAGVTVSALLLSPRSRWWVVLLAAAVAEITVDQWLGDAGAWSLAGFALANTTEPLVGATVVRRLAGRPDLARRRELGVFLVGAAIVAPALGAAIGAFTVWRADGPFGDTFLQWWLGDGLGVVLIGSVILALRSSPDRRSLRTAEGAALVAASAAMSFALFWTTNLPLGFVVLIGVVTAGARFGTRTVTVVSVVVAGIAVASLGVDDVLLQGIDNSTALVLLKLQFAAFSAAGLVVAAEAFERERAVSEARHEHETVEHLQRALLPHRELNGPHFSAVGVYDAAGTRLRVGGDWYDVLSQPHGRVFAAVGDVVGHGTEAVIVMGRLRFAMSAFASLGLAPDALLERMDDFVRLRASGTFTTVWTASFDPGTGVLAYSSAGHPPALLRTGEGGWQLLEAGRSVPLGVERAEPRPAGSVTLRGPSTLVMYTDGVVERPGEVIDTGIARLRHALEAPLPPGGLESLLRGVTTPGHTDDAVLLRIDFRPRC